MNYDAANLLARTLIGIALTLSVSIGFDKVATAIKLRPTPEVNATNYFHGANVNGGLIVGCEGDLRSGGGSTPGCDVPSMKDTCGHAP